MSVDFPKLMGIKKTHTTGPALWDYIHTPRFQRVTARIHRKLRPSSFDNTMTHTGISDTF